MYCPGTVSYDQNEDLVNSFHSLFLPKEVPKECNGNENGSIARTFLTFIDELHPNSEHPMLKAAQTLCEMNSLGYSYDNPEQENTIHDSLIQIKGTKGFFPIFAFLAMMAIFLTFHLSARSKLIS